MVVQRRALLMGLVTSTALLASGLYFWRFGDDHGLVAFLLGCGLLVVAVVHGVAWHESRVPLLTVDMTGLMVRLGGQWAALPWSEVELVEITRRGRIGDGRVTVQPRDERRSLGERGMRSRVAALLNRWLYDASLVVPYGLTARASVDDVPGTVLRLADGRVPVVVADEEVADPVPTVELAGAATPVRRSAAGPACLAEPERVTEPEPGRASEPERAGEVEPATARVAVRAAVPSAPRRLAAVVSALRSPSSRRQQISANAAPHEETTPEPVTVGALALSEPLAQEVDPLPELPELRRRAPEDLPRQASYPPRSANVELVMDATADLSAGAMRRIRQRPSAVRSEPLETAAGAVAVATAPAPQPAPAAVAIGERIQQARERLDTSVDDLAERTRIRPYVIESIEVGDFAPCGGDFYARGHLRMLCGALGIDPAPLLASYDEHLAVAPVSPRAVFDAELSTGVVRPTGRGSHWGALVAAVLVLLLAWAAARLFITDQPQLRTAPGPAGAAAAFAAHPGTPDIRSLQVAPPEPTRVMLRASGGSSRVVVWDRAMKVVYQGYLQDGQAKTVSGRGPLRVMAVDGGVVALSAAGHPRAAMGAPGQPIFIHVR